MADKVIIDGIDVSDCMWYIRAEGCYVKDYCSCYCEFDICKEKTDCYYKQLQRKTAECEELKNKLDEIFKVLFDGICNSGETRCNGSDCDDCSIYKVLNIIEKAKGGE